jgi:hypothetical protein
MFPGQQARQGVSFTDTSDLADEEKQEVAA